MTRLAAFGWTLLWLLAGAGTSAHTDDLDGDGVSDALEQRLIEKFAPRLWLDAGECAGQPAEFRAGSLAPRVRTRNGTLYARVSPARALGIEGPALEVHYYHLWDRDCGPLSPHPLDVEHVSALLVPRPGSDDWAAKYWYAAAHENTLCDTSNAARAAAIDAAANGPSVWVSAGKHASFLAQELCGQRGCGVDRCDAVVALPPGAIVNLGERGRPLNGAAWIASSAWPLDEKLERDFTPELVAAVEASEETVLARVNGHGRSVQLSLSVGGDALGALGAGGRYGAGGVTASGKESRDAIGRTFRAVGGALFGTARALGLARDGEQ